MENSRKTLGAFTIRHRRTLLLFCLGTAVTLAKGLLSIIDLLLLGSSDGDNTSEDGDLIGDYNFRTRNFDNGTDPYGWYEEDL